MDIEIDVFDVPEHGRLVRPGKSPYSHLMPEEEFELRKEAEGRERSQRFAERAQAIAGPRPVRAQDVSPAYAEKYADEIGEAMYSSDRLSALRNRLVTARRNH